MLNMLKNMIKEQKAYLEAADLILEEDEELDDSIILGDSDMEEDGDEEMPTGNDDLPEPVGAQTGEPAQVGDDDLLGVTIDLGTNTQTDTLPIPPSGAGDSIEDNDSHYAQSGFGSGSDLLNSPVDSGDALDEPIEPDSSSDVMDSPIDSPEEDDKDEDDEKEPEKDVMDDEIEDSDDKDKDAEKTESVSFLDIPIAEGCSGKKVKEYKEEDDDTDVMDTEIDDAEECATSGTSAKAPFSELTFLGDDLSTPNGNTSKTSDLIHGGIMDWDDLDSPISEAITVGNTPNDQTTASDDTGAAPDTGDALDATVDGSAPDTAPTQDNAVTSAVKDKISELDAADDTEGTGEEGGSSVKDTLLKKLGNLTKSLEDAKKTIMDKISN